MLGKIIKPPVVIKLQGDLGAGKTVFVSGLAQGLGIAQLINSPTFTISREYSSKEGVRLIHADFYRLQKKDLAGTGLEELTNQPNVIMAIEWPNNLNLKITENVIKISLTSLKDNPNHRSIFFEFGRQNKAWFNKIQKEWNKSK